MSHSFIQQDDVQKLLREGAGLNGPEGNERFKSIIHRLLGDICTLIDDYNVTQEEFWHAVNYLHELGGRQEAALLAAGLGLEHFLDLRQKRSNPASHQRPVPRVPSKGHCMWLTHRWLMAMPGWMTAKMLAK